MSELTDLYQEVILDHNKRPRNFRKLEAFNRTAEGYNPLCGDRIHLFLEVEGDRIKEIGFQGSGCAISKASSSIMTAEIKGKTKNEVGLLFQRFQEMVTGDPTDRTRPENLGNLAVFAGVREFPSRIKCATLAWHTLKAALESRDKTVSIEEVRWKKRIRQPTDLRRR